MKTEVPDRCAKFAVNDEGTVFALLLSDDETALSSHKARDSHSRSIKLRFQLEPQLMSQSQQVKFMEEGSTQPKSIFIESGIDENSNEHIIIRACWTVFFLNIGIAVFEMANGLLGYSPLLIIDGLTSVSIAAVMTTTLLGIHLSDEHTVNEKFYYSRGKLQFLAALVVGIILGVAGITYWGLAIKRLGYSTMSDGVEIGIAIGVISIFGNLLILRFLRHVRLIYRIPYFRDFERLQELCLLASFMVLQSYFCLVFGWVVGDRIARFSISLVVIIISFFIIKDALNGLMDRSSGENIERDIVSLVKDIDTVEAVQWVRTRRVGNKVYAEIKIEMHKDRTVSEFDLVTKRIKEILSTKLEESIRVVNVEYTVSK